MFRDLISPRFDRCSLDEPSLSNVQRLDYCDWQRECTRGRQRRETCPIRTHENRSIGFYFQWRICRGRKSTYWPHQASQYSLCTVSFLVKQSSSLSICFLGPLILHILQALLSLSPLLASGHEQLPMESCGDHCGQTNKVQGITHAQHAFDKEDVVLLLVWMPCNLDWVSGHNSFWRLQFQDTFLLRILSSHPMMGHLIQ